MIARIRRWQSIPRDEIQEVLDHGRDSTDKEVKEEIYIRRLTKQREVDRMGVYTAFHTAQKRIGLANQACAHIAKKKKKKKIIKAKTSNSTNSRHPQSSNCDSKDAYSGNTGII